MSANTTYNTNINTGTNKRTRIKKLLARTGALSLLTFILVVGGACTANPDERDLALVKRDFLSLRFNAPLSERFVDMSDKQLFEIVCRGRKLNAKEILKIIKTKDPEFYRALGGGNTSGATKKAQPEKNKKKK